MKWREHEARFQPEMPGHRRAAVTRRGLGHLAVWMHEPGSLLQAIAVLLAVGALVAWVFHAAGGRAAWSAVDTAMILWLVGGVARRRWTRRSES